MAARAAVENARCRDDPLQQFAAGTAEEAGQWFHQRLLIDQRIDPTLTRSFGPLPAFGDRMLRVVHRPDGSDVFVVTATWDRGASP